jgi:hypothetical protein
VAQLSGLRKKCFGRHSERSEESLLVRNKALREILRATSALRMTAFHFFPQPVNALKQKGIPIKPGCPVILVDCASGKSTRITP